MLTRVLPAALLAASLAACGSGAAAHDDARPDVVATTTQLGDVVRAVVGRDADVHQILQPNTDPHEYEPRPADVQATAGATLVVESGNALDHLMGDIVQQVGGNPVEVTIAPDHTPYKV